MAVTTAPVSGEQQAVCLRVARLAHLGMPAANRLHGKAGRVMVDAYAHPPLVTGQVVDPLGDGLAQPLVREVLGPHLFRFSFWLPLHAVILEIPRSYAHLEGSYFRLSSEVLDN